MTTNDTQPAPAGNRHVGKPAWVNGPHPQKWAFKKDMPADLRHEAYRIDFGLHGIAWVARDVSGDVLMQDGRRMPTFDFYLNTPGHVIGPRDMQAASHLTWAFEWQTACGDRMMERFNLHVSLGGAH